MSRKSGIIALLTVFLVAVIFFAYYTYEQNKLVFKPVEGFSVTEQTMNMTLVGVKWLDKYIAQYEQKYVPRDKKVETYEIDELTVLDEQKKVIQIDFSVKAKVKGSETPFEGGMLEGSKVKYQWVLWFNTKDAGNSKTTYEVYKKQRPAGYDLEQYNTNGQKEKDEYEKEFVNEKPFEEKQYTYKIENKKCFVSYDFGKSWNEVPVPIETLAKVGDGNSHYNELQEGSYVITPKKTAFVYGGTQETGLMMVYSEDQGATWQTTNVSQLNSVRVKFCSFPTVKDGYVIATSDRTMSQEGQVIYATSDGGKTWHEAGFGPSTWLLQSGGFVDKNVGFMSYPSVQGEASNFYRTENGAKTFAPITLPIKEEWKKVFIQPETPYMENGKLSLLVGQGDQGDFQGGRVMVKYQSKDMGKTWEYVELVTPPSKEEG
ncbi:WD40/YVTN/BNR-like repeat-containing protein [Bacillus massiliigorillae]|uniref:WD40/YVTN/BNR-like repeat-containing protein n=1 Tax=Bacillus massiliigorillae TaxID=1243664 RepID=UPI0003A9639F|nr:sialidase family protein [Bacillus massiliigorillae]